MAIARLLLTATLSLTAAPFAAAQDRAEPVRHGRTLVTTHCSRCHAIERTGASPHRQAPPFRTLGQRYPIESLQEALAEGISTGHPDMPEFVFDPAEINAILAYLQSIQVPKSDNRKDR